MKRRDRDTLPVVFAGMLLAIACAPAAARAAEPDLTNDQRAEQLFRSGEKKFDGGDYAAACTDFEASLRLGAKLGTLLNLALCHETIGRLATAWNEFHQGAAWAAQNGQRERQEYATAHVRALEGRLPRVVLQLPADRALSGIDLDGEPLAETHWYVPLYLDPGEHRLALTAPGKRRTSVAFRVVLSPTDQIVALPRLPDDPWAPASDGSGGGARRVLGIGLVGLGIAGVVVGTIFGVRAATADEREASVTRDAGISTAAFLGGVALGAGGGYVLGGRF